MDFIICITQHSLWDFLSTLTAIFIGLLGSWFFYKKANKGLKETREEITQGLIKQDKTMSTLLMFVSAIQKNDGGEYNLVHHGDGEWALSVRVKSDTQRNIVRKDDNNC